MLQPNAITSLLSILILSLTLDHSLEDKIQQTPLTQSSLIPHKSPILESL